MQFMGGGGKRGATMCDEWALEMAYRTRIKCLHDIRFSG